MADKTVIFHTPPKAVREYVKQWNESIKEKEDSKPEQLAMMEDILQLIDIAIEHLQPGPANQQATKN